jgi:hypothetical protein
VIANIHSVLHDRMIQEWGKGSFPPSDTWKKYPASKANSIPQDWVHEQFMDPSFWEDAPPYEDTLEWMIDITHSGYDLHIVTARGMFDEAGVREITQQWFEDYEIPVTQIHYTKSVLDKRPILQDLQVRYMIEDDPIGAEYIAQAVPCYLLSREYNRREKLLYSQRIESVWEIDNQLVAA